MPRPKPVGLCFEQSCPDRSWMWCFCDPHHVQLPIPRRARSATVAPAIFLPTRTQSVASRNLMQKQASMTKRRDAHFDTNDVMVRRNPTCYCFCVILIIFKCAHPRDVGRSYQADPSSNIEVSTLLHHPVHALFLLLDRADPQDGLLQRGCPGCSQRLHHWMHVISIHLPDLSAWRAAPAFLSHAPTTLQKPHAPQSYLHPALRPVPGRGPC